MDKVRRIHHLTAIAGPAQENYDFYSKVLGLRLVKQTVNFDDTATYHFYFSNQNVDLGTILTFFPWSTRNRGVKGSGQVGRMALSIPKNSLEYWTNRLEDHGVQVESSSMFGKEGIIFEDSHTLRLAMVELDEERDNNEIVGFYGAELLSSAPEASAKQLVDELGLELLDIEDDDYYHLETVGDEAHHIVIPKVSMKRGRDGVGTVHHIAWSMQDKNELEEYQALFQEKGHNVTEVKDRNYFKSIYKREVGHVLYEYATDDPGFAVDEDFEQLGQKLMLPEQYEGMREEIEAQLPELKL